MAVRISETEKETLENASVPLDAGALVLHKTIMDYIELKLDKAGVIITEEIYRSNIDGKTAQCVYKLDKSRVLVWSNSYMQGMRFKCGSGIYLKGDTYLIGDTEPPLRRTIDVLPRVCEEIDDVITNLDQTIKDTVSNFKEMKLITLDPYNQGCLLGAMYGSNKALSAEQASIVAKTIVKTDPNDHTHGSCTLIEFYNQCAVALKRSHPKSWVDDHRSVYDTCCSMIVKTEELPEEQVITETEEEPVDPAQLNLIDEINEAEAKGLDTLEPIELKKEDDLPEDETEPVYDEDQITERIRQDEGEEITYEEAQEHIAGQIAIDKADSEEKETEDSEEITADLTNLDDDDAPLEFEL